MNADALYQATKALRLRLEAVAGAGNVFVGPLDDPDVGNAALILFLYRIVPNASMRNREHRVALAAGPVAVYRNALPLDLHYLLTVGRTPDSNEEILLKTLGAAMQALQRDPDVAGPEVAYETAHVTFEPLTTEEISRVWALFPTANYRTSVAYVASPVWIDPAQPETPARPVVADKLDAGAAAAPAGSMP
jgi:hypothetical protein